MRAEIKIKILKFICFQFLKYTSGQYEKTVLQNLLIHVFKGPKYSASALRPFES